MENLIFYVGVIGNIISILVFASPIKTFCGIVKNRSTEEFESAPYVFTLLSSSLWVYYGITKPNSFLVATVNSVGIVLEAIYVSLFLIFASPVQRAKTTKLVAIMDIGFLGAILLVTQLFVHEPSRVMVIGSICTCFSLSMYGSPLVVMKTVIMTKSVEYMPFFLSFFLFLNGGVWTLYAILDKDVFLGIPNGIGFVLGAIQLVLYLLYANSKVSKCLVEEEWPQQEPLILPVEYDEEEAIDASRN